MRTRTPEELAALDKMLVKGNIGPGNGFHKTIQEPDIEPELKRIMAEDDTPFMRGIQGQ